MGGAAFRLPRRPYGRGLSWPGAFGAYGIFGAERGGHALGDGQDHQPGGDGVGPRAHVGFCL